MPVIINGTTGISGVDGSAATPAVQGGDTNTGVFFPAADTVAISTGGTERMRIDASGNVGIGTSSPSGLLELSRASGDTVLNVTSGSATFQFFQNATGVSQLINYYSGGNITVSQAGAGYINFGTNNAERMRIDSSGNVGIGTTSPSCKLHITGTSGNINAAVVGGSYAVRIDNNVTYGLLGSAIFGVDSTLTGSYQPLIIGGSQLVFCSGSAGSEALRVESAGVLKSQPTYDNTATGSTVVVTSTGAIRRTSSSIKYKKDIEDLDPALADNAIANLRPVWYRSKNANGDDKAEWSHIGLIAEEVDQVEKRLVRYRTVEVTTDENGQRVETVLETPEPEDVDYARLSVLLLDKVQRMNSALQELKAEFDAYKAAHP